MSDILFLTLRTFSKTGGIEKVCRIISKALSVNSNSGGRKVEMISMYDAGPDSINNPYFDEKFFRGFEKQKLKFVLFAALRGRKFHTVLLSHINLLPAGWLIKMLNPKTRLVLFTHGIEVWDKLGSMKRMMLHSCNDIISVSHFTKQKLVDVNKVPAQKITVLNNCLDPFLPKPHLNGLTSIREEFKIPGSAKVMLTLTRLSVTERKKGYLHVISAMKELVKEIPDLYYVIAGGYDEDEKDFIMRHAASLNVKDRVILPGFIADEKLPSLFSSCNLYIMPSSKEGFGIVFIEALYYGIPVIGGNADGTADALRNGTWGTLVTPGNISGIAAAIKDVFNGNGPGLIPREEVIANFGFDQYQKKLQQFLN